MSRTTKGGVSKKTINGKDYYYYQWYENGKRRSRTISIEEAERLKASLASPVSAEFSETPYDGIYVFRGNALEQILIPIRSFQKRYCFDSIVEYLHSPCLGKVCALYGIRRTGKSTLMLQRKQRLLRRHLHNILDNSEYLIC